MAKVTNSQPKYDRLGYGTALIPGLLSILLIALIPRIMQGNPLMVTIPWVPSLDVQLSFMVDGLIRTGEIESQQDVMLFMQIKKMRATRHSRKKHLMEIGE